MEIEKEKEVYRPTLYIWNILAPYYVPKRGSIPPIGRPPKLPQTHSKWNAYRSLDVLLKLEVPFTKDDN